MQHRSFPFRCSPASIAVVMTEDHQAFTHTVERHRHELQRHCARLTNSHADAEDALQETLLRAWRSRRSRSSDSPRGWLYRIATNACHDVRNRRVMTTALEDAPAVAAPVEQCPDATVLARETLELALLTAIQHLSPRQRAALIMRDVLDWPADEVAAALCTTVPAVNSTLQRARRNLRGRLASGRLHWSGDPACRAERETLARYLTAIDATTSDAAADLLLAK
jgi:RNA polymerase sigma factor (sigma-70 family)